MGDMIFLNISYHIIMIYQIMNPLEILPMLIEKNHTSITSRISPFCPTLSQKRGLVPVVHMVPNAPGKFGAAGCRGQVQGTTLDESL